MRIAATSLALAATLTLALSVSPADAHPAPDAGSAGDVLTTKTPYAPQGDPAAYEKAPRGFTPVFTENVSRHGTRTMSDADDGDAILALVDAAAAEHALTARGQSLGADVRAQLAANEKYGYGLLTPIGDREMQTTAERLVRRLPGLFSTAEATHEPIDVVAQSSARTVDSAGQFVTGLEKADPAIAGLVSPTRTDEEGLLYFHKSDPAYKDYLDNDPRIGAAEDAAEDSATTHRIARQILLRSFTPAFVDEIAAGDHADGDAGVDDEVAAAEAFYALDQNAADVPGSWHFGRYITHAQAAWFGYLDDVVSFYENGPGFAGSDITYKMAQGLLDDVFGALEAKRDGTSDLAAKLRFTHAEEIFPLETLLGLPGSTKQQAEGDLFTYDNNPFRGAEVAPMAANLQWDLYRSGQRYVVRMLVNEKQTRFRAGCTPIKPGSYFYDLDEVESCYGWTPAS